MKPAAAQGVLIVEDDRDIRETLAEIIDEEGYPVATAGNGIEALEALRVNGALPALILLDLMMPVMDGFQFRAEQQKDPGLCQIPVVLVSADGQISEKAETLRAAGHLRKPIQIDQLLSIVGRFCGEPGN